MIEKSHVTLAPIQGRDYTCVNDVKTAFLNGNDFVLQDVTSPKYGKLVNILYFTPGTRIRIRYSKLARIATIEVPPKESTATYLNAKWESGKTRW